jgi:hypothetical protein
MVNRRILFILSLITTLMLTFVVTAQNEFAATLEVLNAGVEVQRVNTANFIAVEVEAIVGVGDTIRTDDTGIALVTFFADGTDVTLDPNTEYRIVEFQGDDEDFQLTVEVLAGQTTHRLNRVLGANSNYDVETPGMTLAAQGTVFTIRVEDSGRSGMLVSEGIVDAGSDEASADVPPEFGIRSEVNNPLSDVVRASSFDELDSALDGCTVSVTTPDDVSMNVRVAPSVEAEQIGFVTASTLDNFIGVSADGLWYRIGFEDDFGWILSSTASVDSACAGLRVFEADMFADSGVSSDEPAPEATEEAGS